MAGLINEEDLATIRERSRIEDVVASFVTLRPAGGGSLVGLCPFHDEKTPSFRVTPARGFYHCFGCGEGGDVINFVQRANNLGFVEAVEYLADRVGVQLRYTAGDGPRVEPGLRLRILGANAAAAEFYQMQLLAPGGLAGRQFLGNRGFDQAVAAQFGIGFAPTGGKELGQYLRSRGFTDTELVKAGLVRESGWDYFQGRVLWPIRDAGKSVLGFGARRIFDDDRMPAKYLNTPETLVYKKSQVLYGLDLARGNIAKRNQAVVVEGYTDVMACHLAGVDTAVASCGTAFGDDHARLLQRLLGTGEVSSGEVIFTFDGDTAGQAAALKVFKGDQNFAAQTYVAVAADGLDPCDLRIQSGDLALRELVGSRIPLYLFVMRNAVSGFDLDRVDGRLAAVRATLPLMGSIRDQSLLPGYLRELSQLVGMDPEDVRKEAKRHRGVRRPSSDAPAASLAEPSAPQTYQMPPAADRRLEVERGTLRLLVRSPGSFDADSYGLTAKDFTHPTYQALFEWLLPALGDPAGWTTRLRDPKLDPVLSQLVLTLGVEPVLREPTPGYAREYAAELRMRSVSRAITELKSRLQRTNPLADSADHTRMFTELVELERQRKELAVIVSGDPG